MPSVSIQQLLMAGAHFGHLTRRWNPKMDKYIFDAKHGIHIIDLKKTQVSIDQACSALQEIVKRGEKVLFIGTKKQAKDIIRTEASRINMPFVCERWLGGMLTNFSTIRKSLKRLQALERISTDGTYEKLSKKERLSIEKDKGKLDKALGGIREMKKLPAAVFVVDIGKEHIAVAEARKLSIPVVAIVDTNTDPDIIDYPIPGNDDAFKSIGLITKALGEAIEEAAAVAAERRVAEVVPAEGVEKAVAPRLPGRRRRPRRRPPRDESGARPAAGREAEPAAVRGEEEKKPTADHAEKGGKPVESELKVETVKPVSEPADSKTGKGEESPKPEASAKEKETASTDEVKKAEKQPAPVPKSKPEAEKAASKVEASSSEGN